MAEGKKRGGGCLRTILIGGLVVIGLIVVAALFAPPSSDTNTTASSNTESSNQSVGDAPAAPAATATPEPPPTPLPAIGQDVVVDEVRWKILTAEKLGNTLTSDNEFIDDLTTSGTFVRVRFEIENLSKDMLSFAGLDLVDDQERTFTRSSDTIMFIDEGESCLLENLNPNITKTCTHIYEVPADATGVKAQLGDLKIFGGQEALVALGF
jgi:hypothetical protein